MDSALTITITQPVNAEDDPEPEGSPILVLEDAVAAKIEVLSKRLPGNESRSARENGSECRDEASPRHGHDQKTMALPPTRKTTTSSTSRMPTTLARTSFHYTAIDGLGNSDTAR